MSPLQGWGGFWIFPGRCPGLYYGGLSGLGRGRFTRRRGGEITLPARKGIIHRQQRFDLCRSAGALDLLVLVTTNMPLRWSWGRAEGYR